MKILNVCLWHNWESIRIHYDYSEICVWSSGTTNYRKCKCCGKQQQRDYFEPRWRESNHDIKEFQNNKEC